MPRSKKYNLISIREAAAVYRLQEHHIRHLLQKYHVQPVTPPHDPHYQDKRRKWFPRELIAGLVSQAYPRALAS